jgi:hypothetical protein
VAVVKNYFKSLICLYPYVVSCCHCPSFEVSRIGVIHSIGGGGKLKLIELLYIADYILDERCETETNQDLQQYNKTSMTAL